MRDIGFNRIDLEGKRHYIEDFTEIRSFEDFEHEGYIKCRLVHHPNYSVVIPDQVFFKSGKKTYWIQPLYFSGNIITWLGDSGFCDLGVDISHGSCLRIRFWNKDIVSWLKDGSLLYKCKIKGPKHLYKLRTGRARIRKRTPYIKLYHHTTQEAKTSILKSAEFWPSNWNIQGTKKSKNISYLYLTSLPNMSTNEDLTQIAMSSSGQLGFRVDSNLSSRPDLILEVYRESTFNRRETLFCWVKSTYLSPQPCFRHKPPNGFGYHEIVSPFIHRIGVQYGTNVAMKNGFLLPQKLKFLGYAVVGDATKIDGLAAPFDEENTSEKLYQEVFSKPNEIIEFWVSHSNSNQSDNKDIEEVRFE